MKKNIVLLTVIFSSLVLFNCSKNAKKQEKVETRTIEQILTDSLSSKSVDNNFFLGFYAEMPLEEYNKVLENLIAKRKAEPDTTKNANHEGSFNYKFYLKNNICKTTINPYFDKNNKLQLLVILFDTPVATSLENIEEQILDFLKDTCGKVTQVGNHLPNGEAFNSIIYHFVKGKIYTSYMFSEVSKKHIIRYTTVEHEMKKN